MARRFNGTVRYFFKGDQSLAKKYVGLAQKLIGNLTENMSGQRWYRTLPDGTTIDMLLTNGGVINCIITTSHSESPLFGGLIIVTVNTFEPYTLGTYPFLVFDYALDKFIDITFTAATPDTQTFFDNMHDRYIPGRYFPATQASRTIYNDNLEILTSNSWHKEESRVNYAGFSVNNTFVIAEFPYTDDMRLNPSPMNTYFAGMDDALSTQTRVSDLSVIGQQSKLSDLVLMHRGTGVTYGLQLRIRYFYTVEHGLWYYNAYTSEYEVAPDIPKPIPIGGSFDVSNFGKPDAQVEYFTNEEYTGSVNILIWDFGWEYDRQCDQVISNIDNTKILILVNAWYMPASYGGHEYNVYSKHLMPFSSKYLLEYSLEAIEQPPEAENQYLFKINKTELDRWNVSTNTSAADKEYAYVDIIVNSVGYLDCAGVPDSNWYIEYTSVVNSVEPTDSYSNWWQFVDYDLNNNQSFIGFDYRYPVVSVSGKEEYYIARDWPTSGSKTESGTQDINWKYSNASIKLPELKFSKHSFTSTRTFLHSGYTHPLYGEEESSEVVFDCEYTFDTLLYVDIRNNFYIVEHFSMNKIGGSITMTSMMAMYYNGVRTDLNDQEIIWSFTVDDPYISKSYNDIYCQNSRCNCIPLGDPTYFDYNHNSTISGSVFWHTGLLYYYNAQDGRMFGRMIREKYPDLDVVDRGTASDVYIADAIGHMITSRVRGGTAFHHVNGGFYETGLKGHTDAGLFTYGGVLQNVNVRGSGCDYFETTRNEETVRKSLYYIRIEPTFNTVSVLPDITGNMNVQNLAIFNGKVLSAAEMASYNIPPYEDVIFVG